jgi:hypothetical protein
LLLHVSEDDSEKCISFRISMDDLSGSESSEEEEDRTKREKERS